MATEDCTALCATLNLTKVYCDPWRPLGVKFTTTFGLHYLHYELFEKEGEYEPKFNDTIS